MTIKMFCKSTLILGLGKSTITMHTVCEGIEVTKTAKGFVFLFITAGLK
jgi:hypothetical protein